MGRSRQPARTPSPPPSLAASSPVRIRHPYYDYRTSILLSFESVDECEAAVQAEHRPAPVYGVHFGTVRTACAIVACNRFDGFLARDRNGREKVELGNKDVLPAGDYWFHAHSSHSPSVTSPTSNVLATSIAAATIQPKPTSIPAESLASSSFIRDRDTSTSLISTSSLLDSLDLWPYPIVPTFRKWPFPDVIPDSFLALAADGADGLIGATGSSTTARSIEVRCLLTADSEPLNRAHIIPTSEEDWFDRNGMAQYAGGDLRPDAVDSDWNIIPLRNDVHSLFDRPCFSLLPKHDQDGRCVLTAHVTTTQFPAVHKKYQNLQLRNAADIPGQYFLARFAYDLFPALRFFHLVGQSRHLSVMQPSSEVDTHFFTGPECKNVCKDQGRGRSGSPSKRQKPEGGENQSLAQDSCSLPSLDSNVPSPTADSNNEHDYYLGPARKRSSSMQDDPSDLQWRLNCTRANGLPLFGLKTAVEASTFAGWQTGNEEVERGRKKRRCS